MDYKLNIPEDINVQGLFGNYDANIRSVEKFTGTEMSLRDNVLTIRGRDPELAGRIIARLMEALNVEPEIDSQKLSYLIEMEAGGKQFDEKQVSRDIICYTHTGRPLKPLRPGCLSLTTMISTGWCAVNCFAPLRYRSTLPNREPSASRR